MEGPGGGFPLKSPWEGETFYEGARGSSDSHLRPSNGFAVRRVRGPVSFGTGNR